MITREAMLVLLKARPFTPFELHTSDGRNYRMAHPELAFVTRTQMVLNVPDTERVVILPLLHIAGIEMSAAA